MTERCSRCSAESEAKAGAPSWVRAALMRWVLSLMGVLLMLCRAFSLSAMLRQTEPSKGRVRNVKRSATELSGGGPPSWIRTNDLSLRGEVTALCSVGSGWRMVRRNEHRSPEAMGGEGVSQEGCLARRRARFVFMRSNRALQRRQLVPHGCSSGELARTEGFEPPPSGSVIRRIVQFCYVRVVHHDSRRAGGDSR